LLEELTLTFPDFNVVLSDVTHLNPNFCFECGTGAPVPFTQSTGSFSGHSVANPALHTIDADVSGILSFIGPTDVLDISQDPPGGDVLSEPVQWSGSLTITQLNRVLFNGTVGGSGGGLVSYETNPTGVTRLAGYQFAFNGLAETPEPASIILLATGAAWVAVRRRKARAVSGPLAAVNATLPCDAPRRFSASGTVKTSYITAGGPAIWLRRCTACVCRTASEVQGNNEKKGGTMKTNVCSASAAVFVAWDRTCRRPAQGSPPAPPSSPGALWSGASSLRLNQRAPVARRAQPARSEFS
jgi:hypothetical protein